MTGCKKAILAKESWIVREIFPSKLDAAFHTISVVENFQKVNLVSCVTIGMQLKQGTCYSGMYAIHSIPTSSVMSPPSQATNFVPVIQ